jgi:hypothetical protein
MRKPELLLLPLIPALGFAIVEIASQLGSATAPVTTVTVEPVVIVPEAPPAPPPPCIECTARF